MRWKQRLLFRCRVRISLRCRSERDEALAEGLKISPLDLLRLRLGFCGRPVPNSRPIAAYVMAVTSLSGCQSASDRDPGSASHRDPLVLRFERLALAPSELVGVAETGRARVGV